MRAKNNTLILTGAYIGTKFYFDPMVLHYMYVEQRYTTLQFCGGNKEQVVESPEEILELIKKLKP